jgi:hypothetical protein
MQITITDLLSAELTRRLLEYKKLSITEEKEVANHRYLCIQTAIWMAGGGRQPAITKPVEEVRAEITRWMKEIQRNSTIATVHSDGRNVVMLNNFLESTKPVVQAPVQTTLL